MSATFDFAPSPNLERVVARLVSDGAFRTGFFADPPAALRHAGLRLAAAERDALTASPLEVLDALEGRIEEAVSRRADPTYRTG